MRGTSYKLTSGQVAEYCFSWCVDSISWTRVVLASGSMSFTLPTASQSRYMRVSEVEVKCFVAGPRTVHQVWCSPLCRPQVRQQPILYYRRSGEGKRTGLKRSAIAGNELGAPDDFV